MTTALVSAVGLFILYTFNLLKIIKDIKEEQIPYIYLINKRGWSLLYITARYKSCGLLKGLLKQYKDNIGITEVVFKAAAENEDSGKEVIVLLLN